MRVSEPMPTTTPRRRAFIVAISAYKDRLPGPTFDVGLFARILRDQYGFEDSEVLRIEDKAVTPQALDDGLSWLIKDLQKGDRAVFYYSGHGDRVERDGELLEALLCVDGSYYFDTRFVQELETAPAGTVTAIIDACHSGGLDRDDFRFFGLSAVRPAPAKEGVDRDGRLWSDSAGGDRDGGLLYDACDGDRDGTLLEDREPWDRDDGPVIGASTTKASPSEAKPSLNAVLLAACRFEQTSDIGMRSTEGYSPLTWGISTVLQEQGVDISNQDLHRLVKEKIEALGLEQVPVLYTPDSELPHSRLGRASFILLKPDAAAPSSLSSALVEDGDRG